MRRLALLMLLTWLGRPASQLPAQSLYAHSLYAQSLQTALTHSNAHLEFLLLDLRTRETLVNTFADPAQPIPTGSIIKPFLAYAYAQSHSGRTLALTCHGNVDRCWNPRGHGPLALPEAIAQSCNAYFLALAHGLTPAGVAAIQFVPAPPRDPSAEDLIGLTPAWRIAPAKLAGAYADLLAAPASLVQEDIRRGLQAAAEHGTAVRVGHPSGAVLAKTGTAPCLEPSCKASGDGLVVAIVPAENPKLLLLLRRRATTGAMAAQSAGRILTQLQALHAY